MDELKQVDQMNIFDLSDEFVNVCFNSIEKLKDQMTETQSIFNLFQSKMSNKFSLVENKIDDRTRTIFKHKEFAQKKYLKELDDAFKKVREVLREDFNLLNFMGNLKVQEAIIVEGRKKE